MKLLVDAQLPRRLADWLTQQDHDALHTLDLSRANRSSDIAVIRRAEADGRTVATEDADFVDSFQLRNEPSSVAGLDGQHRERSAGALWQKHLTTIIRAAESSKFVELTANAVVIHS